MTQYETKILLHLNKIRGQNNVNHVLSEMLEMTEYDVNQAIISLYEKGYIYEESNMNQKNDGLKAWKIHGDGQIKVKELTNKLNLEKEEQKQQSMQNGIIGNTISGNIQGSTIIISDNNNRPSTNNSIKIKKPKPEKEESLIKKFISKFWWTIIIPLAIGVTLLIVEYKLFGFNR